MKRAQGHRPLTGASFTVPENIVQAEIDPTTGLLATDRCLDRQNEFFIRGTEPAISCYGNSYEQLVNGTTSIYSSPSKKPTYP